MDFWIVPHNMMYQLVYQLAGKMSMLVCDYVKDFRHIYNIARVYAMNTPGRLKAEKHILYTVHNTVFVDIMY